MAEVELPEYNMNMNGEKAEVVYIKREKQQPPSLSPQKHPHGTSPPLATHPHSGQARSHTYGNDNSSVNRQSRTQTTRPDPIPGAPYAGANGQRMGSAMLRKYNTPTIKGSGQLANAADFDGTETSRCGSAFQKPHARFNTGLEQVMSQHNVTFQPPMPKPPLFSTW